MFRIFGGFLHVPIRAHTRTRTYYTDLLPNWRHKPIISETHIIKITIHHDPPQYFSSVVLRKIFLMDCAVHADPLHQNLSDFLDEKKSSVPSSPFSMGGHR